jgi:hypothetical protein
MASCTAGGDAFGAARFFDGRRKMISPGIAAGYEDLNDHDEPRHDPPMAVLAGKLAVRRDRPRHMTRFPGGGSLARAR